MDESIIIESANPGTAREGGASSAGMRAAAKGLSAARLCSVAWCLAWGTLNASELCPWPEAVPAQQPTGDPVQLAVLLGAIASILGAFAWYLAPRWPARKKRQQQVEQSRQRDRERMLHPRFSDIELRFDWRVPQQIRELYQDQDTILRTHFYVLDPVEEQAAWFIAAFVPADLDAVQEWWPPLGDAFVFARAVGGCCYFVPTRNLHPTPLPVFLRYGSGDIVRVADTLEDFLGWPRVSAQAYDNAPAKER